MVLLDRTAADRPQPGVLPALQGLVRPPLVILLAGLLLRTVLLVAGNGLAVALTSATAGPGAPPVGWNDILLWSNVVVVAVDVVTVIAVAWALRRSGKRLGDLLRTSTPARDLAWGLLLGVIAYLGFFVATFLGNLIAYQGPPPMPATIPAVPPWLALWSLLLMPVTIAVAEETLYRGYLQSGLSARWGRVAGLLVTAAFFGLQHLALTPLDPRAGLARVIAMVLCGVLFGLFAWWMKRLWPLIVAHWILDVVGLGVPLMLAAWAR